MGEKNECNIVSDTEVTNIPSQKEDNLEEEGGGYLSSAHQYIIQDDLVYSTAHTNDKSEIPTKEQSASIVGLQDIAKSTNQEDKIVDFPPIDHEGSSS